MGYEIKLYVVNKTESSFLDKNGKVYAQVIATFDACRFDTRASIFTQTTDCYIYDDGDVEIIKDKYGNPLKEATVQEVVNCLENLPEKDADYRRAKPLLALMRAFAEDITEWESLAVLCYGY